MIYATNSRIFLWIRKWYFQIRADDCLDKLHECITLILLFFQSRLTGFYTLYKRDTCVSSQTVIFTLWISISVIFTMWKITNGCDVTPCIESRVERTCQKLRKINEVNRNLLDFFLREIWKLFNMWQVIFYSYFCFDFCENIKKNPVTS